MVQVECPCGSEKQLSECCGPILDGTENAITAEALMRSRYTAHALGDFDHIDKSNASAVRGTYNKTAAKAQSKGIEWVGLEITETVDGGKDDDVGVVTYAARFMQNDTLHVHRERSSFCREDGTWFYVDGKINPQIEPRRVTKVGRNDPCSCGSGKKFKKCCGA